MARAKVPRRRVPRRSGGVAGAAEPEATAPGLLSADPGVAGPRLNGEQARLRSELAKRSSRLAGMYVGVLTSWSVPEHPDRDAVTAHGCRELLDHLSDFVGISRPGKGQTLKGLAQAVIGARHSHVPAETAAKAAWTPHEVSRIRIFLKKFAQFEQRVNDIMPSRRIQQDRILARLDPVGQPPEAIVGDLFFDRWQAISDYMNSVAHHRAGGEDLGQRVLEMERFLLDYLVPRPVPAQREIRELIHGKSDA